MECEITCNYNNNKSSNNTKTNGIQPSQSNKSQKSGMHVNFVEKVEVKKRREKFLTAKYGSHQMSLIRKRLAVEMWLYEELQKLSGLINLEKDFEVDIDELLDMNSDNERRHYIKDILSEVYTQYPKDVEKFINEVLEKSKTL